jgi:hypothetical protein
MVLLDGCRAALPLGQSSPGNRVTITGEKGNWNLTVNGKPFQLKGVGVGYARGADGTDYLAMARELGANTVRTWGTRQGTPEYLNRAHREGLYVNAGIWLNPVYEDGTCSYLTDAAYQRQVRRETLDYVKKHRRHPAILFWNIGNEVISFTKREEERVGFARFLEQLVQEVHALDPDHPVVYTSSFTTDVPYIQQYVPSVDLIGLNIYGGLEAAHLEVTTRLNIPYVVTEFGPLGPWDRPRDLNGRPVDLTDAEKAVLYQEHGELIRSYRGYCLGGFAFLLGETSQASLTWWNMNYKRYRRRPFLTVKELYTGEPTQNYPPVVSALELSKQQNLQPGEEFEIRVAVREPEGEAVHIQYVASTDRDHGVFEESPNQEIPLKVVAGEGPVKAQAPAESGMYRIYALAIDPHGLAGTLSRTISVAEHGHGESRFGDSHPGSSGGAVLNSDR